MTSSDASRQSPRHVFSRRRILIVEDSKINIDMLADLLSGEFQLLIATNGETGLKIARSAVPDIILLDVVMPGINGYEVCKRLKQDMSTRDIPVIFITSLDQDQEEELGLSLGAVDYITKPFRSSIVLARVLNHLELKLARELLKHNNETLETKVRERTEEINRIKDITIHCLASLAETRDNETGAHIMRTKHYVKELAEWIAGRQEYAELIENEDVDLIFKSAPLHDIGKVGVPDYILHKPGKLDCDEFELIKMHTVYGLQALEKAETELKLEGGGSFLRYAKEITYTHHERWDGKGYPRGLAGRDIPFSGRLMALADVYDALISKRVYKPPFSHEKACEIIFDGKGAQFDPLIVEAFEAVSEMFQRIAKDFEES